MGFALVLFTLFVVLNLIDSRSGRAIMAIRDNRIAAEAMGLNVTKYKMMAFVTSAVLAGMAGALYGLNFSTVAASKFKFDTSILVLVFVVLGGIGNIRGSIISATLLTILPELLRAFADYRMLIYAIVLILVMLATNNPTLRSMVQRIIPQKRGNKKEARRGMTEAEKKRAATKMVPAPSHSIIPERDLHERPVLEARHLGIDFGGLTCRRGFQSGHRQDGNRRLDRTERRGQNDRL